MTKQPKNILIIKPGAIGDLLQLSPVVRALKKLLPQTRITIMVANTASIDLFRHNTQVDEVLVFEKRGEHRSWRAFAVLWAKLRQRNFDLVINYQRSNLKAWLLAAAAFPGRVLVYHRSKDPGIHAVTNHLQAVAPLGIDPNAVDNHLELFLGAEDERWASEMVEREGLSGQQLVALNLGASHPVNRWPVENFANLAGLLSQELDVAILLVGGPSDRELADAVLAQATVPVVDLVGHTSLLQLGAVLRKCSLLVSGDTGPMHLATAVGTRVVALFGAADPARTGPIGDENVVIQATDLACVPCRSRACKSQRHMECMKLIDVDQVFQTVKEMLRKDSSCAS